MPVKVVYTGGFTICVADFGEWSPGDVKTISDELAKGLLVREDFSKAKAPDTVDKKPDTVVPKLGSTEDAAKK
jgi:hypothetical protein